MTQHTPQINYRITQLVHSVGLSCLGGAIFLQILVFSSILGQGYFRAIETNPYILSFEVILTGFTAFYFLYVYHKIFKSIKSS
ncbi:MAG: hypothetical protein NWF01_08105 [Candidatus Bathyarchaeota archaeon]|nr:hypothetical protein [Candidatus Bathyarchaeota archaeon]